MDPLAFFHLTVSAALAAAVDVAVFLYFEDDNISPETTLVRVKHHLAKLR